MFHIEVSVECQISSSMIGKNRENSKFELRKN
jgi:hypothetical protein